MDSSRHQLEAYEGGDALLVELLEPDKNLQARHVVGQPLLGSTAEKRQTFLTFGRMMERLADT